MKYITTIVLAIMLTACSLKDDYQFPQAADKAAQMCAPYGGVDKTATNTYAEYIYISTFCKDGTHIQHRIPRE